MRRIDRQRRQHREQLVQELGLQPLALGLGDPSGVNDLDPDAGEAALAETKAAQWLLLGPRITGPMTSLKILTSMRGSPITPTGVVIVHYAGFVDALADGCA